MLVVCVNSEKLPNCEFQNGHIYRHLEIEDWKEEHMVYGVIFDNKTFKECFESYTDIVVEKAKELFYVNGKPMTKKAFREMADIHVYSGHNFRQKVLFFGHPKRNCFAFKVEGANPKIINEVYDIMKWFCIGEISEIVNGSAKSFNSGIPLSLSSSWWLTEKLY